MSNAPVGQGSVPVERSTAAGPRRELSAAVLLCLAGAALALLAAGRTWLSGTAVAQAPLPPRALALTAEGLDLPVRALALLGLAGVPALAATRRWGRVLVGAVVLAAGVGVVVLAAGVLLDPAGAAASAAEPAADRRTLWPAAALLGGLLLAVAGLLVAVRGPRWARLSARYDAPAARRERPVRRPEVAAWEALDRGEDPTGADGGQDRARPEPGQERP